MEATIRFERTEISIHTLRMEGDAKGRVVLPHPPISIHTLRMEGD